MVGIQLWDLFKGSGENLTPGISPGGSGAIFPWIGRRRKNFPPIFLKKRQGERVSSSLCLWVLLTQNPETGTVLEKAPVVLIYLWGQRDSLKGG